MTLQMSALLGSGGGTLKVQEFLSSGTWTRPAGVDTVYVQACAGGGGGGGASANEGSPDPSGGGGGGEYAEKLLTVTGNLTIAIGAGGAGGAGWSDGSIGNSTIISGGASLTLIGGGGGMGIDSTNVPATFCANAGGFKGNGTYGAWGGGGGGMGGSPSYQAILIQPSFGSGGSNYNSVVTYKFNRGGAAFSSGSGIPDRGFFSNGGIGINGFCGGGGGGGSGTANGAGYGSCGGGHGSNYAAGGAGRANSGGGGGGTRYFGNGGNGGSGYCLIAWVE